MINTPKASKSYLAKASRELLNKIVKQHNIKNTSRMKISDLRDLMYQKRVRQHDPDFREPNFNLRPPQVQVKIKDLKKSIADIDKKLKQQKLKTVKYVKKVVQKKKTIKGQKSVIKDQDDIIKGAEELDRMAADVIKDLEAEKERLKNIIMNL